jgi:hypothetical protein
MKLLLTCLIIVCFSNLAISQDKPVLPEVQRLDIFIGHWTVEGSEDSYLEVCNSIQGNHVQCNSTSKEKDGVDSAVSYLSYSPLEKTYVYYGLYSSGNSRTLRGRWEIDRFIFEGQRVTTGKTTKWRVTMTPVGKNIHFVEETSTNGGEWDKKADFIYKRLQ